MLINKRITVLFIIFLAVIFLLPESVLAAEVWGTNDLADAGVNLGTRDLRQTIAGIVNIFLGFLGVLATLIILYGGFVWMTSNGNAEKVDRAKRILLNGAIGLVIVVSSYAIARFILQSGYDGTFGTGSVPPGPGYVGGVGLGAGALDSHYPPPYATDVPRNTNLFLTFKEPMDVSMIVADPGVCAGVDCEANGAFVNLFEQGNPTPITGSDLVINYSVDPITGFRTFHINPYGNTTNNLGSNTADVIYRMELGDLQTQNGSSAFPYSNSYQWFFTTGTEFDFTPPKIVSVRPLDSSVDNPRNSVVQINFDEAVNPALATGDTSTGFNNIRVTNYDNPAGPTIVEGEYKISNQYRTVELITTDLCGTNSCGGNVYCLPASDNTDPVNDLDAFVSGTGTVLAGNVIADMSDNILDGDNDDAAGGDYTWIFATNNLIDLVPPTISQMDSPNDISLTDPIEVTFDKPILASSVNTSNADIVGPAGPINYWLGLNGPSTISLYHDRFDPTTVYTPTLTSGIQDTSQNCWYPCRCDDPGGSCVCNTPVCSGNGFNCVGS